MEYKHLKTGSSMISWRASARKRVFSVSPLLYYQYLWVGESGKSPWYLRGWRLWILQNFEFPHPFPSNSKQCREFSPAQGQRSQFISLYSPTYSPVWPGVLPQGQADDTCITPSRKKDSSEFRIEQNVYFNIFILDCNRWRTSKIKTRRERERKKTPTHILE